ncbi:MAG: [protein-PII] uridylyltransferase [Mariprofundaceae bacterium]
MSVKTCEITAYSDQLKEAHEEIQRLFAAGETGSVLVSRMCEAVDAVLERMWKEMASAISDRVDLLAVGGYGRGELCPHSDWDVWFLLADEPDAEVNQTIEHFIHALWDMNVKLGYAVRTVDETLHYMGEDWHTATAALESRLICGQGVAYAKLQGKLGRFFSRRRKAFVEAKLVEMQQRHARTGDTAFLMEPDIKEGMGGLRDVQTVFWLAKAWHDCDNIAELVSREVISQTEHMHLMQAQDFLWRCRVGLHLASGRANDRLGFAQQMDMAADMEYQSEAYRPAVEAFMKDYFRHAGRISRVSGLLCMHFEEELHPQWLKRRKDIGDGFVLEGQRVGVRDDQVFEEDPLRLLRIFHVAQQDHRELSSQALRQVREHVLLIDDAFRTSAQARAIFLAILRHRRNVASALKEMNDTGVLGRFIPEFRHTVGLGQFNNYHVYTVDEHTIRAVGEARNMWHHLHGERMPLATQMFSKLQRQELLYLALICHDIAKGKPGDHSRNGAEIAYNICHRLHLSRDASELVAWLVQHHLLMAMTSQRSDLTDPEVISRFAAEIGHIERLRYLLCLTVADIAAVGPGIWNEWKGTLLRELFIATESLLMGEEDASARTRERVAVRIESTLGKVEDGERNNVSVLLHQLPWRAVVGFPPRHLLRITRLMQTSPEGGVDVLVDASRGESLVVALAEDRRRLLADLTTALSSSHVNIVAAQAFMLEDKRVLDVFHIQDSDGKALSEKSDLHRLKDRIKCVLAGDPVPVVQPVKANILMRQVSVQVKPLPLPSSRQTSIEVSAADRPGLLAVLTGEIDDAGFNVRGAGISSFGERAVDVFFLTNGSDETLREEEVKMLCERLAHAAELTEETTAKI